MRKTSQDGGDSASITSGVENETKKSGAIIKTKRNSIKRKVQGLSHESDDTVIEPLLQRDREKPGTSSQGAKYNFLSEMKTDTSSEGENEKDKLLQDENDQKPNQADSRNMADTIISISSSNQMPKSTNGTANLHNHMNTNIFNSHDAIKSLITTKSQMLVEIDGSKQSGYNPSPLIFTTAKIHTDGKTKQMEPLHVTPVPILSTIEVSVIKGTGINKSGESSSHVTSNISSMYDNIPKNNTTHSGENLAISGEMKKGKGKHSKPLSQLISGSSTVDIKMNIASSTSKIATNINKESISGIQDQSSKKNKIEELKSMERKTDFNKNFTPTDSRGPEEMDRKSDAITKNKIVINVNTKQLQRQKVAIDNDLSNEIKAFKNAEQCTTSTSKSTSNIKSAMNNISGCNEKSKLPTSTTNNIQFIKQIVSSDTNKNATKTPDANITTSSNSISTKSIAISHSTTPTISKTPVTKVTDVTISSTVPPLLSAKSPATITTSNNVKHTDIISSKTQSSRTECRKAETSVASSTEQSNVSTVATPTISQSMSSGRSTSEQAKVKASAAKSIPQTIINKSIDLNTNATLTATSTAMSQPLFVNSATNPAVATCITKSPTLNTNSAKSPPITSSTLKTITATIAPAVHTATAKIPSATASTAQSLPVTSSTTRNIPVTISIAKTPSVTASTAKSPPITISTTKSIPVTTSTAKTPYGTTNTTKITSVITTTSKSPPATTATSRSALANTTIARSSAAVTSITKPTSATTSIVTSLPTTIATVKSTPTSITTAKNTPVTASGIKIPPVSINTTKTLPISTSSTKPDAAPVTTITGKTPTVTTSGSKLPITKSNVTPISKATITSTAQLTTLSGVSTVTTGTLTTSTSNSAVSNKKSDAKSTKLSNGEKGLKA